MPHEDEQSPPPLARPGADPLLTMLMAAHVDLAVRLAVTLGKGKGSRLLRDHCRALRGLSGPLGYAEAATALTNGIEVFAERRGLDASEEGPPPGR